MEQEENENVTIESVKKMIAKRDEIDRVIAAEEQVLAQNNIDMQRSLVDSEGFPITGVDIYSVRKSRNAIICAQNDRQKLTAEIEKAVETLHKQKRNSISHPNENVDATVHRTSNAPFARIARVMDASPAFQAGIKDGDEIIQFGSLHAGNFNDMSQLSTLVQNSVEKVIRVTVLRDRRAIRLELVPRPWSGRGILGCAVLPVTSAQVI